MSTNVVAGMKIIDLNPAGPTVASPGKMFGIQTRHHGFVVAIEDFENGEGYDIYVFPNRPQFEREWAGLEGPDVLMNPYGSVFDMQELADEVLEYVSRRS